MTDLYVSISPQEVATLINKTIINYSITGELIDEYVTATDNGATVIVQVYEKHYARVENRLTLTVVIDNMSGKTHIHAIGGGGGQGCRYLHCLCPAGESGSLPGGGSHRGSSDGHGLEGRGDRKSCPFLPRHQRCQQAYRRFRQQEGSVRPEPLSVHLPPGDGR